MPDARETKTLAVLIDAMDVMYKRTLDGVVLVSSDSDLTRLAQRLREDGLEVYGFGERKAVEAFRNACKRFIYVENLLEGGPGERKDGAAPAGTGAQKKAPPNRAWKIIAGAIGERDADGWENLASVGQRIQGAHPDLDPRIYGCAKPEHAGGEIRGLRYPEGAGRRSCPPQGGRTKRIGCRQGVGGVTWAEFNAEAWIERLAQLLPPLAQAQEPFLREYLERYGRVIDLRGRQTAALPAGGLAPAVRRGSATAGCGAWKRTTRPCVQCWIPCGTHCWAIRRSRGSR